MAPLNYATLGGVKRRLGITDTTDDTLLTDLVSEMNQEVEDITGRAIGPFTITNELLDGHDAIEDGACLLYPKGVRSISLLEVASNTGASFATVPSGDYYLRPTAALRQPDWPAFEIWMTDSPSAGNSLPTFLPGYDNIRLTGSGGWASIPSTVVAAAEVTVCRAFLVRQGGPSEGSPGTGVRTIRSHMWEEDLRTLRRYTWKMPEIY